MSLPVDYAGGLPLQQLYHDPNAGGHDGLEAPALAPPLPSTLPGVEGFRYEDLVALQQARAQAGGGADGEIVATAMQLMQRGEEQQQGGYHQRQEAQQAAAPGTGFFPQDAAGAPAGDAGVKGETEDEAGATDGGADGAEGTDADGEGSPNKKKRNRNSALSSHEALTMYAHRGIYVDEETGELRTSSNHKCCAKWDRFKYERHFTYKVYKKYETEHLHTDAEQRRLLDAKERFFQLNPAPEEDPSLLRRRRRKLQKEQGKVLTAEQLRVQEKHWMEMWQLAKGELKELRDELREETDAEVRAELVADIEGLKRRKGDWAQLLGLNPTNAPGPENFIQGGLNSTPNHGGMNSGMNSGGNQAY